MFMKKVLGFALAVLLMGSASALALERSEWLSPDQYYYQQLSAEHKAAWEKDITNALSYPNQKKQNKDRRQQALAKMIIADNPRIFWIDWIDSNGLLRFETGNTPHYKGLIFPQGKTLADYQQLFQQGVDAAVKAIKVKLPKNADAKAKVKAIYKWVRNNCTYSSAYHFKDDWRQAGYMMLTGRYGDCYYHFGATKLMLERLNIPNIDVKKVPNYEGDSNHYWHLVSVDGGENYYHVDTTPRKVSTYFCMVTDKHMDDFSAKYRNCFNRDKSLYPATPETTPW